MFKATFTIFLKYVAGPFVGVIAGKALLEVCHAFGWWPDRLVAGLIMTAATDADIYLTGWLLSAAIGIFLYAVAHRFLFVQKHTDTQPTPPSHDTAALMRDIGRLKDILTGWDMINNIRDEATERYKRIEKSDHLIWQEDTARRLRNDFLNRCGIIYDDREHGINSIDDLEQNKAEMREFADQLLTELRSYKGP